MLVSMTLKDVTGFRPFVHLPPGAMRLRQENLARESGAKYESEKLVEATDLFHDSVSRSELWPPLVFQSRVILHGICLLPASLYMQCQHHNRRHEKEQAGSPEAISGLAGKVHYSACQVRPYEHSRICRGRYNPKNQRHQILFYQPGRHGKSDCGKWCGKQTQGHY